MRSLGVLHCGWPRVLGLDRDAALAFEVHRVGVLGTHVARIDRAGELQDAV
jgi:hypothetical protein